MSDLTIPFITGLAAADAVNPCVLAILTIILTVIFVRYPKNKKQVLMAGFAFTLAVYITYFFYGLIIIQFFKSLTQSIDAIKIYIYQIIGVAAIILGLWNIKDFLIPGNIPLEIPMSWRPKMRKIAGSITSPKGAFVLGFFLTLFLLPCTIGPYIIAGGILEKLAWVTIIPWLAYYNIIFVLPMIGITLFVYGGFSSVERAAGWRKKNVRYLHLIAGIILIILGALILSGMLY